MSTDWTVLKVLTWTAERFAKAGIPSPRLDAEVLLAHVLGTTRLGLYTAHDQPLDAQELTWYRALVRKRLAGHPVAYLVGEQEFWSLPMYVDSRVLVPRRDTETLVTVGLEVARSRPTRLIADVATGSGAVAIALATELTSALVVAIDMSKDALHVARRNVLRHHLENRVALMAADLVSSLEGPFDLIVSNPPYIPTAELEALAPEVACEPRAALDGGPEGLTVLSRLIRAAPTILGRGGTLAVEHAHDQGTRVRDEFRQAGFEDISSRNDLAGCERVTFGRACHPLACATACQDVEY